MRPALSWNQTLYSKPKLERLLTPKIKLSEIKKKRQNLIETQIKQRKKEVDGI